MMMIVVGVMMSVIMAVPMPVMMAGTKQPGTGEIHQQPDSSNGCCLSKCNRLRV